MCGFVHNETFKTDKNNPPIKRKVQLYSRASQLHIQIRKSEVDARGQDGSEYGKEIVQKKTFHKEQLKVRYSFAQFIKLFSYVNK